MSAKTKPVFSLNRRCSAAMRRIAAFVEQRVEAEKALMAADFQRLRDGRGLPSVTHDAKGPAQ
jgi:hypothetical protein